MTNSSSCNIQLSFHIGHTFIFLFTFVNIYIEQFRRAMHVVQALNGNKCNAYFVSGKIKELKKQQQNY